jgi:carbonic anhydrase
MAVADDLLANNRRFAAAQLQRHLDVRPALELAIVTCMDSRLDVFAALGLDLGQAHILRNAGGIVTDDVIRSLALSQRRLGTRAVMLIHHDDCGLQLITEDGFRSELEGAAGERPPFEIGAFSSVEESVRRSLERVRTSPFLLHRDDVRGFVHDVDTGALREVE